MEPWSTVSPARSWGRDALTGTPPDYLPMLATPWSSAFDDPDWWFEVKWDGYRCLAWRDGDRSRLRSRRGLDLAERFPEIASLALPKGWMIDGEIVVFDDLGRANFSLLQEGRPANYVVFDTLISPDGSLIDRPLEERRERLADLDLPDGVVAPEPMRGHGEALYQAARDRGLEGIVAKRSGSIYQPGRRSPDWRKVAARRSLRAVVGGWMPGDGGRRSTFGSLLVGLWDDDRLRWIGAVGSGFSDRTLSEMVRVLQQLERSSPPFAETGAIPRGARWAEPVMVVSVEFKEWTRDLRLRAPVFKGIEPTGTPVSWEEEGPDRT